PIHLPHAIALLLIRPVRLAEPVAQGSENISLRPLDSTRRAVRGRALRADADCLLSGLSRHRGRYQLVGVLVALDRVAVLAERTDVVLVGLAPVQHRGGCTLLNRSKTQDRKSTRLNSSH